MRVAKDRLQLVSGHAWSVGVSRPGIQPNPADADLTLRIVRVPDQPPGTLTAPDTPGVGHHFLHGQAQHVNIPLDIGRGQVPLASEGDVPIDDQDEGNSQNDNENEFDRQFHL